MELGRCQSLVSFTESTFPPALKELRIWSCDNLQYLFDQSMSSSNTCLLEHLKITGCQSPIWLSSRELECVAQDLYEIIDLEIFKVADSKNIKSLPRGLDKLNHLLEIYLHNCLNLVVCFDEIGFPTANLKVFEIEHCENFGTIPKCINNFTSLQELKVWNCGADISFPEEGFPTNLASLGISGAPKIYSSLVEWGLHRLTSLQQLEISGEECSNVASFPEEGIGMALPPPLISITIRNFKNLEFMCSKGFQHLTSLDELYISDCPKLTSLPAKDMLLSLGRIFVNRCPLLKEECTRLKEREWSKISHIPFALIDGKVLTPREVD
ncbi:putative disease resistance protein RGA3 [Hibiscus syriacus]|nr:putative disease resistance protein RGA3 [Hibiscus syriacus]